MTLEGYRELQRRRRFRVARNIGIAGLVLGTLLAISAGIAGKQAAANDTTLMPAAQDQMQEMTVTQQDTAVWTPPGLVGLQGNLLLHYTPELVAVWPLCQPMLPGRGMFSGGWAESGMARLGATVIPSGHLMSQRLVGMAQSLPVNH